MTSDLLQDVLSSQTVSDCHHGRTHTDILFIYTSLLLQYDHTCKLLILHNVSGSDFAPNCQKMSVKQLCIECCLTCSETLGLQGNMSRSFPTPSIKAAREAAACLVPRGKASGAAGFCFKSTQEQKDVSSCDK